MFVTIMPVSYGLTHTFRLGSVLATLSVTLERFFAIVLPLKDVRFVKRCLIPVSIIFTGIHIFVIMITIELYNRLHCLGGNYFKQSHDPFQSYIIVRRSLRSPQSLIRKTIQPSLPELPYARTLYITRFTRCTAN